MFEDEMTEDHAASADEAETIHRLEKHEEQLAQAQSLIRSLEAETAWLRRR